MKKFSFVILLLFSISCSKSGENLEEPISENPEVEEPKSVVATCTDGIKNGNETAIDCGGDCTTCADDSETEVEDNIISLVKVLDLEESDVGGSFYFTDFAVDENSNFWMAHENLGTLHGQGDTWIRKDDLTGLVRGKGPSISIDNENAAWVTFGPKIYKYDTDISNWVIIYEEKVIYARRSCSLSYHSENGNHWFRYGDQFWLIENPPGPKDVITNKLNFSGTLVRNDSGGETYLLGNNEYLFENDASWQWSSVELPDPLNRASNYLSFISKNKIWRFTTNQANDDDPNFLYFSDFSDISKVDKIEGKEFDNLLNIAIYLSKDFFHDKQDRIWISGVYGTEFVFWQFDAEDIKFKKFNMPEGFEVGKIIQGKDGKVYISSGAKDKSFYYQEDEYTEIWEWSLPTD